MSDNLEIEIAEFEHVRNNAMNEYFSCRPWLNRTECGEKIFEAGFRMAWEQKRPDNNILEGKLKSGAIMQCLVDDANSETGTAWHNCKYLADMGEILLVELTGGFAEYCRARIPKTHLHLELRELVPNATVRGWPVCEDERSKKE